MGLLIVDMIRKTDLIYDKNDLCWEGFFVPQIIFSEALFQPPAIFLSSSSFSISNIKLGDLINLEEK